MKTKIYIILFSLITLAVFILPYVLIKLPPVSATNTYSTYWLPSAVSTYAPKIDAMFDAIMWLTMIVFILVEVCFVYFLVRYSYKKSGKAKYYHGNNKLEIIWTAIPTVILVYIGFYSNTLWSEMRYSKNFPKNATQIRISPRQFQWDITYPGPDGKFEAIGATDTKDDINTVNQLHLVLNEPVQITLHAQDVIHSFFVPEFRIKQDAVPGMTTSVYIVPTKAGSYEIACAELCGAQHYRMKGFVNVVDRDSVDRWLKTQAQ